MWGLTRSEHFECAVPTPVHLEHHVGRYENSSSLLLTNLPKVAAAEQKLIDRGLGGADGQPDF